MLDFMNQIKVLKTIWIVSHIITLLSMMLVPFGVLTTGFVVGILLHVVGQGIALHRYFSHRSFKTHNFLHIFLSLITIPCALGSPISWSALHRHHHTVSDTPSDDQSPVYNSVRSIWLCEYIGSANGFGMVRDLMRDKLQTWIHANYTKLLIGWVLAVCCLGINAALILVFIPITVTYTLTMLGSVVVHKWGYRNYHTNDNSKNSLIVSLLTLGDGWHNNHHASPNKIKHGERWFEFDLLYWVIRVIRIS